MAETNYVKKSWNTRSGNASGSTDHPLLRMKLRYTDKTGSTYEYKFAVNPEDYTQVQPNKASITQTKGGAWIDAWGAGITELTIKGITGVRGNNTYGEALQGKGIDPVDTGYNRWKQLQALFELVYKDVVDGEKVSLIEFYNFTDNEYYMCYPTQAGIELARSKSRPNVYQYTIHLWALRRIGEPEQTIQRIGNPNKTEAPSSTDYLTSVLKNDSYNAKSYTEYDAERYKRFEAQRLENIRKQAEGRAQSKRDEAERISQEAETARAELEQAYASGDEARIKDLTDKISMLAQRAAELFEDAELDQEQADRMKHEVDALTAEAGALEQKRLEELKQMEEQANKPTEEEQAWLDATAGWKKQAMISTFLLPEEKKAEGQAIIENYSKCRDAKDYQGAQGFIDVYEEFAAEELKKLREAIDMKEQDYYSEDQPAPQAEEVTQVPVSPKRMLIARSMKTYANTLAVAEEIPENKAPETEEEMLKRLVNELNGDFPHYDPFVPVPPVVEKPVYQSPLIEPVQVTAVTNTRIKTAPSIKQDCMEYREKLAAIIGGRGGKISPPTGYNCVQGLTVQEPGSLSNVMPFSGLDLMEGAKCPMFYSAELRFISRLSSGTTSMLQKIKEYSPEVLSVQYARLTGIDAQSRIRSAVQNSTEYDSTLYEKILECKKASAVTRSEVNYLKVVMLEGMHLYMEIYNIGEKQVSSDMKTDLTSTNMNTFISNIRALIAYFTVKSSEENRYYHMNIINELRKLEKLALQSKTDIIDYML